MNNRNLIDRVRAVLKLFPQPDGFRILGMDTSFYTPGVDFKKARAAGIQFMIGKASGGTVIDSAYVANYKAAKDAGLVTGAYHWLYAGRNISIDAQVTTFAKLVNVYPVDIIAVDFEVTKYGGVISNPTSADLMYFLKHLYQETGKKAMIYTGQDFWKNNGSTSAEWLEYKLWEASYNKTPVTIAPWGANHKLWQWTANGDGVKYGQTKDSLSADLNYYNGTQEQFDREYGRIPIPPPGELLTLKSVTVAGVRVPEKVTVTWSMPNMGDFSAMIDQTPVIVPPASTPNLYRIKDDREAGIVPDGTRPYLRDGLPSTVIIQGGESTTRLTQPWMDYMAKINTPKAMQYIFKPASGWHNTGDLEVVRQLTFSGNVVEVTRIEGNRAYIKHYNVTDAPPTEIIKPLEKSLHPLVQMFSIQYTNHLDMSTDGRYCRTLIIVNPGDDPWIDLRELVKL